VNREVQAYVARDNQSLSYREVGIERFIVDPDETLLMPSSAKTHSDAESGSISLEKYLNRSENVEFEGYAQPF
jgi:hypothetical protein